MDGFKIKEEDIQNLFDNNLVEFLKVQELIKETKVK